MSKRDPRILLEDIMAAIQKIRRYTSQMEIQRLHRDLRSERIKQYRMLRRRSRRETAIGCAQSFAQSRAKFRNHKAHLPKHPDCATARCLPKGVKLSIRRYNMPTPKTMQAAVVEKFGEPLVVREVPVPKPGPGQALVEIFASGVCHTDLHAADGDWPVKPTLPFTPGHEGAGTVVELGPDVTHLKEGDRVGIAWLHSACGHCKFCLSGWETLCLEQKNSGYSVDGSFAQYALAQADYLGRIPDNLSFVDAAPILCAGVTTYKGLKETETRPGEWVVISGVGGLGHVAIQYARAMGLRVAAIDLGPEKMALARKLGAEITVDAKTQDPPTEIQKQIGGAQGVLVTAVSTIAFKQAIGMLRRGGTCVLNGLPPGEFPISIFDVVLNRYTIRGSIVGTRLDLEEALTFAADGKVRATIETQPLQSINDVFARLKSGQVNGRVVLQMREERPRTKTTAA
jgi:propanol-preferring alcohol dehydrogenase